MLAIILYNNKLDFKSEENGEMTKMKKFRLKFLLQA